MLIIFVLLFIAVLQAPQLIKTYLIEPKENIEVVEALSRYLKGKMRFKNAFFRIRSKC